MVREGGGCVCVMGGEYTQREKSRGCPSSLALCALAEWCVSCETGQSRCEYRVCIEKQISQQRLNLSGS